MRQRQHGSRTHLALAFASLLVLPAGAAAAAPSAAAPSEAYGYFRTVEGSSLLSSREPEETRDLEMNLPILAGDAVQVGGGSRVEAVLADGSVARLEAGTELIFDQLANSPDSPGVASTRLVLLAGEMQLRVPEETARAAPVEVESASARVYLIRGGSYWLGVVGDDMRLIVREGTAEVLTEEGSRLVQAGEELEVSDRYGIETRVARAGYERDIERWARDLEETAYVADYGPVEERLHYQAAPLARSGSWVRVDDRVAWRPRVRYGWRPFTEGRWVYTPSGLTWVASTRWGYVTSHYGTWDYLPAFGWCWFPGAVYSPAWVYWYWGPTHAAWVPYGYYARHYGPRYGWRVGGHFGIGHGLRFGVYGWAGGGWSAFADWTFCPLGYFGRRGGRYYYRSGNQLAHARRALAVPRGIITTDTRGIDRAVWTRPYEARQRLGEIHRGRLAKERHGGDLPDVTSFVSRRRELSSDLQAVVKPLGDRDRRPALARIDRPLSGNVARTTEGLAGTRSNRLSVPTKPAAAGRDRAPGGTLSATSRSFGERREAAAGRFETKPLARPTDFERAPTTVYRLPESGSNRLGAGRVPADRSSAASSLSGRARSIRPDTSERRPGPVAGGDRSRLTPERPTVFERAPTPIYRGSTSPSRPGVDRSQDRNEGGTTLGRTPVRVPREDLPVYERKPLFQNREPSRAPSTSRAPEGDRGALERRPTELRPPATIGSGRVPTTVRPSTPSTSSGGSSTPISRPSQPARPASPRAQAPPSRSSSERIQSSPSRSSRERVQSSSSRVDRSRSSARQSSAAAKERARSRKKDE